MQKRFKTTHFRVRTRFLGVLATSLFILAGCTSLENKPITDSIDRPIMSRLFNPYRPDVVQGNFVSKEQLESIRVGMNRDQVKQILGTPLIKDYFHKDRWDYAFMYRVGSTQEDEKRKIYLYFEGSTLKKIDADPVPSEQQFVDEIDSIKKNQKKIDNKVNLKAQEPNAPVNPVPAFPNPTSGAGIPPGGTRINP
jgi:outer membrane protein assembly factor BamE